MPADTRGPLFGDCRFPSSQAIAGIRRASAPAPPRASPIPDRIRKAWIPTALLWTLLFPCFAARGGQPATPCWNVDELQPGMKGTGKTVLKGVEIVQFQAEVLGVMKNIAPGRDMVLVRLSGCGLEQTGVIAGMSGSPVEIDGKLLGAVAYAWQFGKEPIAGITPFSQMRAFAQSAANDSNPEAPASRTDSPADVPSRLPSPLSAEHLAIGTILTDHASLDVRAPLRRQGVTADGADLLRPIQMPLVAVGLGPHALGVLKQELEPYGFIPVQTGKPTAAVTDQLGQTPLVPGSPVAVALMTGDFDLSSIGTVTHVEGQQVWAFGHPFMGLGACEYPMQTGYIHAVYPRQSLSMKLGSGLNTVGTITADVSTCVAGRLGDGPDMLPINLWVKRAPAGQAQAYRVQVVRAPTLLAPLLTTALTAALDAEGSLPEELTIQFQASVKPEGYDAIVVRDVYSGSFFAGDRGWTNVFNQVATIAQALVSNPFRTVRLESIVCKAELFADRRSARIESVTLSSDRFEPGETLKASVLIRPYKGVLQSLTVELPLPADLKPGNYDALVCDFSTFTQQKLRDEAYLLTPKDFDQVLRVFKEQLVDTHDTLFLRVAMPFDGVALDGRALPELPASAQAVFAGQRRSAIPRIRRALVATKQSQWVIEGAQQLSFEVVRDKKLSD